MPPKCGDACYLGIGTRVQEGRSSPLLESQLTSETGVDGRQHSPPAASPHLMVDHGVVPPAGQRLPTGDQSPLTSQERLDLDGRAFGPRKSWDDTHAKTFPEPRPRVSLPIRKCG